MHRLFFIYLLLPIITICLLLPCPVSAQLSDSLYNEWNKLNDSTKVEAYLLYVQKNYRNEPDICYKLATEAIEISSINELKHSLSKAYSLTGVILKNKGDFSLALENHHQSLRLNEELGSRHALATNYNDIGIVYKSMGEYEKALDVYLKANALALELDLKRGVVMTLNNIGTIYEALNNSENSIAYYNQAYSKAVEYEIIDAQAIALNNLGETYANKGDGILARRYFKETLEIDRKTGDLIGSVSSMLNIAATYIGSKKFDSASYFYENAKTIANDLGAKQLMLQVYNGYTKMYQDMGNYRMAFSSLQTARSYQDSLYNENRIKQLAEVEAKYEADKKDQEIKMLRQEQIIKTIEIKQHEAERFALISLIFLGILILIFLYKRYQNKQQQQFNAKILRQKEEHLAAIVETQEQERKRIAKDLHDGVGQTLSGVKLALSAIEQSNEVTSNKQRTISELKNIVDEACSEVRTISHQMMPRVLQEEGLIPAIADMLEKSFRFANIDYQFEHFGISERFKESIEIGLYRISQELVNNIIKHSGADKVTVQLIKSRKMLVLIVEDNGKGLPKTPDKSKGIGLMSISSRVETIHGEFNLEPSPHSGTLATIRIPIEIS